jgi:hypothetical protein
MSSKRKSISIGFKKEVIEYIESNKCSPHQAYMYFKNKNYPYNESNYYQWWKKRKEISTTSSTKKRIKGGGNKPSLDHFEDLLYNEIIEMRIKEMRVTRSLVCAKAILIAQSENIDNFKASSTWCTLFMKRFSLSLRRVTNLVTLSDTVLIQKAVDYISYLKIRLEHINKSRTILMDETACYFEDTRTQTIDICGTSHVILHSTGFSSMRITACISVWADGEKCAPLIIHKGKDSVKIEKLPGPLFVTTQAKAWVNSSLLVKWINLVFPKVECSFGKCII